MAVVAEVTWEAIRSHRRLSAFGGLALLALLVFQPWIATVIVLLVFAAGATVLLAHSELFGQRVSDEDFEDWF